MGRPLQTATHGGMRIEIGRGVAGKGKNYLAVRFSSTPGLGAVAN